MQDMEFTVENGKLYMLQTRTGKRSPSAAFQIAVDMANEKLIKVEEALERIKPEDVERLFYPVIDPKMSRTELSSRKLVSGNQCGARSGGRQGGVHGAGSRRVGGARRESNFGAA